MTIGPAPMIRMLSKSARLGILAHQSDKPLEQVMAVLRAGARLGVVLDGKYRLSEHPQPFVGLVEEREVGRLDEPRQAFGVDDKAVVLTGDLDFASAQILYRMIGAAMAARHLEGPAAERQRQQLMAEADAKDRLAGGQQVAQYRHGVKAGRGRVARPVRQKNPVGTMAQNVFCRGSTRDHGDAAAMGCEHSQDVALCTVIYCNDVMARMLLSAVADPAFPHGLGPSISLSAGYLDSKIHPFETRPRKGARMERGNVEIALRIVADGPVWRPDIANPSRQAPRIDPGDPDQTMRCQPGIERRACAVARSLGDRCAQDEPAHGGCGRLHILAIRTDIADVGKGEGDDLTGIRGVCQDLLIAGHCGVEADLANCRPDSAKAAAPEYAAVGKDECRVAVGWSQHRHAHFISVVPARCGLPGRLRTPKADSDVRK